MESSPTSSESCHNRSHLLWSKQVMVQDEPRRDEPLYSCVVPVGSVTGNLSEELTTFGTSADTAFRQAQQLLADNYGCNDAEIQQLMQLSSIEYLSPWCSPGESKS